MTEVETEVRKWLRQQSKGFCAVGFNGLVNSGTSISMLVEDMSRNKWFLPGLNITCFTFYIRLWPTYWFSLVLYMWWDKEGAKEREIWFPLKHGSLGKTAEAHHNVIFPIRTEEIVLSLVITWNKCEYFILFGFFIYDTNMMKRTINICCMKTVEYY
jgi:hypothetical protein